MGLVAAVPHIQESWRRDLMAGLNDAQPASKLPNHGQLASPSGTLNPLGLLGPFQRQWDRNELSLLMVQELDKPAERFGGFLQSSAQGPSGGDVFGQMVL
jgi:hypothetical protein